jgi:hypothetical protein
LKVSGNGICCVPYCVWKVFLNINVFTDRQRLTNGIESSYSFGKYLRNMAVGYQNKVLFKVAFKGNVPSSFLCSVILKFKQIQAKRENNSEWMNRENNSEL